LELKLRTKVTEGILFINKGNYHHVTPRGVISNKGFIVETELGFGVVKEKRALLSPRKLTPRDALRCHVKHCIGGRHTLFTEGLGFFLPVRQIQRSHN
jgi:hypothetical protein